MAENLESLIGARISLRERIEIQHGKVRRLLRQDSQSREARTREAKSDLESLRAALANTAAKIKALKKPKPRPTSREEPIPRKKVSGRSGFQSKPTRRPFNQVSVASGRNIGIRVGSLSLPKNKFRNKNQRRK